MNYQPPNHQQFGRSDIILGDALNALDGIEAGSTQLILSSPPYNIGKSYERGKRPSMSEYVSSHAAILDKLITKLSPTGSLCWQVGNHIKDGQVFPLDYFFYPLMIERGLVLRNRIIWRFNFGLNAEKRFSGRYETLLWFTKSDKYTFNLDAVRVPQKYPGKRHASSKGARAGKDKKVVNRLLTTTFINAFLITLRLLIESSKSSDQQDYTDKLSGFIAFDASIYHSSQYRRMAEQIVADYFS